MTTPPHHTNIVAGPTELVAAIITNYQCGHCNSDTALATDNHGTIHLAVHHDDGCPVLTGALSSAPDTFRAAAERQS